VTGSLFVDTSALFALLDLDDARSGDTSRAWREALAQRRILWTSNYIVVETLSLLQRRLGVDAVRAAVEGLLPNVRVHWICRDIHEAAHSAFQYAGHRKVSFVDFSSFEIMRRRGTREALTTDSDFARHGFQVLPRLPA